MSTHPCCAASIGTADVVTESSDDFRGSNDNRTEYCIGGPLGDANVREHRYLFEHDHVEHTVVAKFMPPEATRPVVLICGQSSLANQAAVHYLKRNYREIADRLTSVERFCIMIKVSDIGTYGFQRASFARDVTREAFAPEAGGPPA